MLKVLLKAISILDEVIKVIRASKDKADAIKNLVDKFGFTEKQADAIVTMRLYRLTNTDVTALLEEQENLKKMIEFLNSILSDENILKKQMKKELQEIKKNFGNERRTEIKDEVTEIKIDLNAMIPKENVIVTVTNEGYVKKLSLKSYQSADGETGLKPGDYITGLYSTTTTDTLLLFTNQGRYLYVPIYEVFDAKWKDLGKHISNLIPLSENEKIIGNMILDSKNTIITMITRDGISKRTQLNDLVVSRHSKPINLIKLKGGDELVSVVKDTGRLLMVSKNGYYVNVNSEEIPVLGTKAAGVKGINVKGDEVVGVISLDNDTEYLNIITSQKTAKRIKVADLDNMSTGKRGSTLIKKVKSTNYDVVKVIPVKHSTMLGIKIDSDIKNIKATEIPIMDLSSTGSVMSKRNLEDVFDVKELEEYKINEDEVVNIKEVPDDPADQGEEMTIDDFIEDFKI